MIVFLFRFGGFSETSAAHLRLYNTAMGGGIALLMDTFWHLFFPARPVDAPPAQTRTATGAG